jgi:hypothetical protein
MLALRGTVAITGVILFIILGAPTCSQILSDLYATWSTVATARAFIDDHAWRSATRSHHDAHLSRGGALRGDESIAFGPVVDVSADRYLASQPLDWIGPSSFHQSCL